MAYFKYKPNKLKFLNDIKTLDELHREQVDHFNERRTGLPNLRKELATLRDQLKELESKAGYELSNDDIKIKADIKTQIDQILIEIKYAENNFEELEYFSKTSDILLSYYSHDIPEVIPDEVELSEDELVVYEESEKLDEISDKLTKLNEMSKQNRKQKRPIKKRRIQRDVNQNKSILSFLGTDPSKPSVDKISKATLQDQYLLLISTDYASDKNKVSPIKMCSKCNIEKTLIQADGIYSCQNCGESEYIIIESEIPSHKDSLNEKPKYPYKKINHLIEKLNQYQSKETADIPDNVYTIINRELLKRRIRLDKVTPRLIISILKKYRLNCYYEHSQHIFSRITHTPPPILTREIEDKIKIMFKSIQDPFKRHCPADRSNFLNYSYVLHKIFLILDMPNHARYFSLLKSREKLRAQDIIWKKICIDLNWKFHPSL